jgi:hypothetical protein
MKVMNTMNGYGVRPIVPTFPTTEGLLYFSILVHLSAKKEISWSNIMPGSQMPTEGLLYFSIMPQICSSTTVQFTSLPLNRLLVAARQANGPLISKNKS